MADRRGKLAAAWVFAILLGSYAYFWQSRDWNSASRLMLTYALGDRGSLSINGLENQTGDKAYFHGHYFSDKGPGYSLLALPPYLAARGMSGLPEHPLGRKGFAYWPADYWVTLSTSGLVTALAGALLTLVATGLGCGPRRAALVGLAYGLATPAYVYATLAYGHQATAAFLLGSFALIWVGEVRRGAWLRSFVAGFLAAYAAINELSVGPLAAILGISLLARVSRRELPTVAVLAFGLGALGPTLILLGYNALVFGSPLDMGYAHHAFQPFRELHDEGNPLGLRAPRWGLLGPLLFGRFRGLLFYAPIVALAPIGWSAMVRRGRAGMALVSLSCWLAVFVVNLSYPAWTGGWCTGPRLLVPSLPFAMVAVAAGIGARGRVLTTIAVVLSLWGGAVLLGFQGVGGRIPDELPGRVLDDPVVQVVLPLWRGEPVPEWWTGGRFAENLVSIAWPWVKDPREVAPTLQWVQFVPLLLFQAAGIGLMLATLRPRREIRPPTD